MTQRRPVVDALLEFQRRRPISFHVPGHKNGLLSGLPKELKAALVYDMTELEGLDDLHAPSSAIKEAEDLLATAYGAKKSYFLVNGSTAGNLAMVHAICGEGDHVIVQRNSHKSIFHALELAHVKPVYVAPEWDEVSKSAGAVALSTIVTAIDEYPQATAVVLTYPSYYGVASTELEAIIDYCHERNIPVLIDEAHGAHLAAGEPFPVSALAYGADVVVQSAHKTLPAMTMGSYLHVAGGLVNERMISKYLRIFQSSSPSYPIMASLDDARAYIQNYSVHDKRDFLEKRLYFISSIRRIPSLEVVETDDPLKLLLRIESRGGFQLKAALEQAGIFVELADPFQVLLILPLSKPWHAYPYADIRSRIKEAVQGVRLLEKGTPSFRPNNPPRVTVPELSFEEVDLSVQEWVPYERAIGRISAAMVTPYPPGIPLVTAGEKWTVEKVEELSDYLGAGAEIQGEHRLAEKLVSVIPW
ncbi:aminotransferase class I/II-fold pyridoxal phosphate-dependent enzyme [Planococcus sp. CP5-4]|uniref:aminotransferase class I/II-fold pyridoxal phosphate-dependent enzyme n=1 Tax=unclassified Planococcus (in: firmicutes) TaxID=2662419 RepID=UPI001C244EE5|nr:MULTISPECIES: aminotransferase class I/II-fold pyridoxal phosphate-dependent enzyme [unclassified Planococcus (in: firmicutes)]MBU9674716.1 aminotransferase class I/II-fold pyridoxal phosphate-dependent enzyme [Planococcus sp. CP5-4_YE]MBV0910457.1 aminotransferase class I/II-fold pyridoxal phosphate-dependent enzyme [Planococcus sp. CP5-4_UN]MBW6064854.1 aminotransferase class I/II-fold pyridoxal phosphate-dependent enzyme [Planococcus sp. CP5-4]